MNPSPRSVEPTPVDLLPTGADIRLVVTDMDGTLLAPDGTVPAETWELIEEMRRRGIVFVPASGRQYATLRMLFDRVADGLVFIAENGSVVIRDGEVLDSTPLDGHVVDEVVRRVRSLATDGGDVGAVVCTADTAYVERDEEVFLDECSRYYRSLEVVGDLDALRVTAVKVAVHDVDDIERRTAPVLLELSDRARVVVSGRHWTDVQATSADKGVALRRLRHRLGVDRSQTVVFGDYLNDLGMFAESELGFAMANGHPDVLAAADHVAPADTDNGVLVVMRALLDR